MSAIVETSQQVCFRFLDKSEHPRLEGIYQLYGGTLPSPALSSILVAELGEDIIGMVAVNAQPIVTMWIDPIYRSSGLWVKLAMDIQEVPLVQQERTYVICDRIETEEMCKQMGLRRIEVPVYVRDV